MSEPKKFLSVKHIVFMIIVQVLAFNNIPRCYYQMGYSAIPILILAALLFFVPYSFMMAEYGSALRDDAGGLYNWMERSLGTKFAFCGFCSTTQARWYGSCWSWPPPSESTGPRSSAAATRPAHGPFWDSPPRRRSAFSASF